MITEARSRTRNPFKRFRETNAIVQSHPDFPVKGIFAKLNTFRRGGANILQKIEQKKAKEEHIQELRQNNRIDTPNPREGLREKPFLKRYLKEFLQKNPHVLEELRESHKRHPDQVTLAVVFKKLRYLPDLVLAEYNDILVAYFPSILCSSNAITQLRRRNPYEYAVYNSSSPLDARLYDHIISYTSHNAPIPMFDFNSITMRGEDYLALAVQGNLSKNDNLRFVLNRAPRKRRAYKI